MFAPSRPTLRSSLALLLVLLFAAHVAAASGAAANPRRALLSDTSAAAVRARRCTRARGRSRGTTLVGALARSSRPVWPSESARG